MIFDFSAYPRIEIPEGRVKQIARASDGLVLWKAGYINQVPLSINADGSIYNDGLGYKTGYRIRSGGAETALNGCTITGYIRVNAGDVVRFYDMTNANLIASGTAINASDANFTNIGQAASNANYGIFFGDYSAYAWSSAVDEGDGVYRWIVPPAASGVAYIRVGIYNTTTAVGENMIVTINEEIA